MNIMILAVVGIIVYMFTRKKGIGSEPAEPVVQKIHLATGTVKTAVIVKGSVKVNGESPFIPRQKVKCPTGSTWSVQAQECIKCPVGYMWSNAMKGCRKTSGWITK